MVYIDLTFYPGSEIIEVGLGEESPQEPLATTELGATDSATFSTTTLAELLDKIENSAEVGELTINKDLMVLGKTTVGDLGVTGKISAGLLVIDGLSSAAVPPSEESSGHLGGGTTGASLSTLSGPLKLQDLGLGDLEMMKGKVKVDTEGNLAVLAGVIKGNEKFRQAVKVATGKTSIGVEKAWEEAPNTVNVTPSWKTTVWVTDIDKTGFTIHLGRAPDEEKEVYWLAIW